MKRAWAHTIIGIGGAFAIAWWFHQRQLKALSANSSGPIYGGVLDQPQGGVPPELLVDPIKRAIEPLYTSQYAYAGMDGFSGKNEDELMENAKRLMKQAQEMMESL